MLFLLIKKKNSFVSEVIQQSHTLINKLYSSSDSKPTGSFSTKTFSNDPLANCRHPPSVLTAAAQLQTTFNSLMIAYHRFSFPS